jgi:hypothetical protein
MKSNMAGQYTGICIAHCNQIATPVVQAINLDMPHATTSFKLFFQICVYFSDNGITQLRTAETCVIYCIGWAAFTPQGSNHMQLTAEAAKHSG